MRPIDADKILKTHELETKLIGKDWTIDDLAAAIESAPILDVMPVKHGRWVKIPGMMLHECSECQWFMKGLIYNWAHEENMSFCPNCGAKMEERL